MARIEELAWQDTPWGEINLRRRKDPVVGRDVYEVKLGEEFLMSSAFTAAEVALAHLALAELEGTGLKVAVGGLGLGFTAAAVLENARVQSMTVVDALQPVIDWHVRGLIPSGAVLVDDPRCQLVAGDFFALVRSGELAPSGEIPKFDAIVVDIDHSPTHALDPRMGGSTRRRDARSARAARARGSVALWSNDPPDPDYTAVLEGAFERVRAEVISFPNPLQGGSSTNTVYVAVATGSS